MNDLRTQSSATTGTRYRNTDSNGTIVGTLDTSTIVAYVVLALAVIYQYLHQADFFSLLSIPEVSWNCCVYLMPSWIIFALDHRYSASDTTLKTEELEESSSKGFAAKSEAMRRLMGWESGRLFSSIPGPSALPGLRRLSSVGSRFSPPGLGNWDNSCYQNSIIQGLASLQSLPAYLDRVHSLLNNDHQDRGRARTFLALQDVLKKLEDPANVGKRIWTPANLKSMSSWQQQDAQEYFSKVMDEVDKETGKAFGSHIKKEALDLESDEQSSDKIKVFTTNADISALKILDSRKERPLQTSNAVRNPLEGLIAQRVGCMRCGQSDGLSLIPFNCLTVPLGKDMYYDIRDCLDEYTALESIEGVECAKCTLLSSQAKLQSMVAPKGDSERPSQPTELQELFRTRLDAINESLEEDDFSDTTLTKKCKIAPGSKVSTTKSRQAVIARPPESLVIHVNRSLFNEHTGMLSKNYAKVRFQKILDLGPWCLGSKFGAGEAQKDDVLEEWAMDPDQSLLANKSDMKGPCYEIRAVIVHQGRHENGHYIAYRKYRLPTLSTSVDDKPQELLSQEKWWRMSDDDVDPASPEEVFNQGGVFMLFYERIRIDKVPINGSTSIESEKLSTKLDPTISEDVDLETAELEDFPEQCVLRVAPNGLPGDTGESDSREHLIPQSNSLMVTAN